MANKTTRARRSTCSSGHAIEVESTGRTFESGAPIVRLTLEVSEDFLETLGTIVERSKEHGVPFCCSDDAIQNGALRPFAAEWLRRIRASDAAVQGALEVLETELGPGVLKGELLERARPHLGATS